MDEKPSKFKRKVEIHGIEKIRNATRLRVQRFRDRTDNRVAHDDSTLVNPQVTSLPRFQLPTNFVDGYQPVEAFRASDLAIRQSQQHPSFDFNASPQFLGGFLQEPYASPPVGYSPTNAALLYQHPSYDLKLSSQLSREFLQEPFPSGVDCSPSLASVVHHQRLFDSETSPQLLGGFLQEPYATLPNGYSPTNNAGLINQYAPYEFKMSPQLWDEFLHKTYASPPLDYLPAHAPLVNQHSSFDIKVSPRFSLALAQENPASVVVGSSSVSGGILYQPHLPPTIASSATVVEKFESNEAVDLDNGAPVMVRRKRTGANRFSEYANDFPRRKSVRLEEKKEIIYFNPKFYFRKNESIAFRKLSGVCRPIVSPTNKFYLAQDPRSINTLWPHTLGAFQENKCKFCGAFYFPGERNSAGIYSRCCLQGKIMLAPRREYPTEILDLFNSDDDVGKNFRDNIRNYNNMMAFASFGFQRERVPGVGPYIFKIHGQVYHRIGPVHPQGVDGDSEEVALRYAQLYFVDSDTANRQRLGLAVNEKTLEETVVKLDKVIRENNKIAQALLMMKDVEKREKEESEKNNREPVEIVMYIASDYELNPEQYRKRKIYNMPAANEIALIYNSKDEAPPVFRHIAIHGKSTGLAYLSSIDGRLDPLLYPLLFPYGELGWSKGIPYRKTEDRCLRNFNLVPPIVENDMVGIGGNVISTVENNAVPITHRDSDENAEWDDFFLENICLVIGVDEEEEVVEEVIVAGDEDGDEQGDTKVRKFVMAFEYYRYLIHKRKGFDVLHRAGKLSQQFFVNLFARIEGDRINWIRRHQQLLRVEKYQGLHDYLSRNAVAAHKKIGKLFILPSTFPGCPRNMHQNFLDAMGVVSETSKPDFFITMTCNPNWPEIRSALEGSQQTWEIPVIICRVFYQKCLHLINLLRKDRIFGDMEAFTATIEFQKRGLPHLHLLVIMKEGYKPKTAADVDNFVSAMLPDPITHPTLYELVTKCMVHSPCTGSNHPCQDENGQCQKKFPKPFAEETDIGKDGYPTYKRVDNTGLCKLETKSEKSVDIDNSWVVPYNAFLLMIFMCHINVEICAAITAVKYLYKYIYKGFDRVSLYTREVIEGGRLQQVLDYDEIKTWVDGRYLSAIEAVWRLLGFPLQFRSHSIIRLPIHLENEQPVLFVEGKEEEATDKASRTGTKLTRFFELCASDSSTIDLFYKDLPKTYYYKRFKVNNEWEHRWVKRSGKNRKPVIGRITFTASGDTELSCLRVLLLHTPGPHGYDHLRTVDGVVYKTFYEAAFKRGLIETDDHFRTAMLEGAAQKMAKALRKLFVETVLFDKIGDASAVYEEIKNDLSDDYVHHDGLDRDRANIRALLDIKSLLEKEGKSLGEIGLQEPPESMYDNCSDAVSWEYIVEVTDNCSKLNPQQRLAVQMILVAVEKFEMQKRGIRCDFSHFIDIPDGVRAKSKSNLFFLDGPAGSGKTFVYNTVIGILKCSGLKYTCVAPTGLAASLLDGGRTIHAKFRIPLDTTRGTVANIHCHEGEADELRESSLLVWDEISMCGRYLFECVDKCYRDLHDKGVPFGSAVVVCGGDFRQQPPVMKNVGRNACRSLSVKGSFVWEQFQRIGLETNMRSLESDSSFSDWLVGVGEGRSGPRVPIEDINIVKTDGNPDALVDEIFGADVSEISMEDLAGRAILCPKNEDADRINNLILDRMKGREFICYSSDSALNADTGVRLDYPDEYLHGLQLSGMPPHELKLKKGCVIMLLRNLYASQGLCNGTRLYVMNVGDTLLTCNVLTGSNAGETRFIRKLRLEPSDTDLHFKFRRYQFPVRLSYTMTIHKSQGQSFDKVGLFLKSEVFTHGQLYTALSRVKNNANLKIDHSGTGHKIDGKICIKNVVYPEMLV